MVSTQCVKIERIVSRSPGRLWAEFERSDGYFLARAWIDDDGNLGFQPRHTDIHTVETAGQVQIALHMAIEWVVEQLTERGQEVTGVPADLLGEGGTG